MAHTIYFVSQSVHDGSARSFALHERERGMSTNGRICSKSAIHKHVYGISSSHGYISGRSDSHRTRHGEVRKGRRPVRWGRVAVLAIVLAIGFMFGTMVEAFELPASKVQTAQAAVALPSSGSAEAEPAVDVTSSRVTVVVMPGDSLWSIARVHAPEGTDLRKYVHALRQVNELDSSMLQVGQLLVLP